MSTTLAGRSISRTGRYKRFPVAGLALMTARARRCSPCSPAIRRGSPPGIALAVFGLGFGMVAQVLIVAVQNGVERRELGIATATTSFFRGLGGAVGAAVLGAVFAARAGDAGEGGVGLGGVARADVIDGVQAVFAVAAPLAALALLVVLALAGGPASVEAGQAAAQPRARAACRSGGLRDDRLTAATLTTGCCSVHIVAAMVWVGGGACSRCCPPGAPRER